MAIKTLIVDDSVLYRKSISEVAASFKEIEVTGTAPSGDIAIKKMSQHPVDLVFCDVHMPGKDGVETTAEIRKIFPETLVVMMSGVSDRGADITIRALELGAIDFIKKPSASTVKENYDYLHKHIENVLRLVKIKLSTSRILNRTKSVGTLNDKQTGKSSSKQMTKTPKTFSILAIGVSTGGPEALNKLIPQLPLNLPVPCVLVQHMPPTFTQSLAESLNRKSSLTVCEAVEGQPLNKGTIYIAPGGRHMTLTQRDNCVTIGLNDGPPENSCRPSVDVLFRSVASVYGGKGILAVILTGMGSDGCKGVRAMKRKGCFCITQSHNTCVVYGMPRAVDEAGLSDISLPLDEIALEIRRKLQF